MTVRSGALALLFASVLYSAPADTASEVSAHTWVELPQLKVYNPVLTGVSSAIIPGAGQVYTQKFLLAGTFVAAEAITGSSAYFWLTDARQREKSAQLIEDSARGLVSTSAELGATNDTKDLWFNYAKYLQDADLARFASLESRVRAYSAISWGVGVYVFNVLDAIDGSHAFVNYRSKDPTTAFWLAAIPGLGLGQLYNGSISKAGMVFMTQVSMGIVAYNYQRLMTLAEQEYAALNGNANLNTLQLTYNGDWESKRDNAFRNRNMYLWYSIGFYFYSIFDAVVDAHLHDYPIKMKIEPDLDPQTGAASMKLSLEY